MCFPPTGALKYMGALWISSLAREYPQIRLVTISPGGTKGTSAYDSMPAPLRIFAKIIFKSETGAQSGFRPVALQDVYMLVWSNKRCLIGEVTTISSQPSHSEFRQTESSRL